MVTNPSQGNLLASTLPSEASFTRKTGKLSIWWTDEAGGSRIVYETTGYAGFKTYANNPDYSDRPGLGPLPAGQYHVGLPQSHPRLGPLAFRLRPFPANQMFGRGDFFIHGDNRKGDRSASNGCIILNRNAREALVEYRVRHLTVI